ncbi:hypothetical protein BS47DRAFT_1284980, partial [Hydnum rufescens UP504]
SISKDPAHWFAHGEFMWADSGYALQPWCVVPFKKPLNQRPENKTFNYYLSRVRVKSEHTMGYLMGRFGSLQSLRQQISCPRDHKLAVNWIMVCLILHNLIISIEGGIDELDP